MKSWELTDLDLELQFARNEFLKFGVLMYVANSTLRWLVSLVFGCLWVGHIRDFVVRRISFVLTIRWLEMKLGGGSYGLNEFSTQAIHRRQR